MKSISYWSKGAILLVAALMVTACGGGGSDAPANRAPTAAIAAVKALTVGQQISLDGSASSDPDGDPLTYAWTVVNAPPGSAASVQNPTNNIAALTIDKAGDYVFGLTVSDGKTSSPSVTVSASAVMPEIQLDQAEPVSEAAKLSIKGTVTGSVSWYADLKLLGTGAQFAWDTSTVGNGSHAIVARIQPLVGAAIEVQRQIQVQNSSIKMTTWTGRSNNLANVATLATSPHGITKVTANLDGVDQGFLTAPTFCSGNGCGVGDSYLFQVDRLKAGSGAHQWVLIATDGTGATRQVTVPIVIDNAPQIALEGLPSGAIVHGTLNLKGTATTDRGGVVSVSARLGDVEFLLASGPSFAGSLSLSGLASGTYALTVKAKDAGGLESVLEQTLVVASSADLAYTPAFTIASDGWLLAASGNFLAYWPGGGAAGVVVRDLSTGQQRLLADSSALYDRSASFVLDGAALYALGAASDCKLSYCVYQWPSDGIQRINLTANNPYTGNFQAPSGLVARNGFAAWSNNELNGYTLFDAAKNSYELITPSQTIGSGPALVVNGNVVSVFFSTAPGLSQPPSDICRWRSDSKAVTKLTSSGQAQTASLLTDGDRIVWQQNGVQVMPAQGGASTTLSSSTSVSSLSLNNGIAAWAEGETGNSRSVKVSVNQPIPLSITLASGNDSALHSNNEALVLYAMNGKLYSWSAASASSKLRADSAPAGLSFVTGGAMVFNIGNAVYRVPLN